MKTVADLARTVLQDLGVVPLDGDPTATDANKVGTLYRNEFETLRYQRVANWTVDYIPETVFQRLCDYIGALAAPGYGLQGDRAGTYQRLVEVVAYSNHYADDGAEYF